MVSHTVAASFWLVVFAAVFTWGCYVLTTRLLPQGAGELKPAWLAGMVLLINVPAAWFNFKGVQAQIILTGAMLIAAVAVMRAQWLWATFWLFIGFVFKPLGVGHDVAVRRAVPAHAAPLIVALALAVALPFVFFDAGYMAEQYRDSVLKLWLIATVPAQEWPYRADLSTLLRALGIVMPSLVSVAVRLLAALGTLYLAWRVRGTGTLRSLGFALVILSACYINLFSPRNEFLSFLVLTPSVAVLAFLVLARDQGDWRGWALIVAALVLGMWWSLAFDAVAKPAIVIVHQRLAGVAHGRAGALARTGRSRRPGRCSLNSDADALTPCSPCADARKRVRPLVKRRIGPDCASIGCTMRHVLIFSAAVLILGAYAARFADQAMTPLPRAAAVQTTGQAPEPPTLGSQHDAGQRPAGAFPGRGPHRRPAPRLHGRYRRLAGGPAPNPPPPRSASVRCRPISPPRFPPPTARSRLRAPSSTASSSATSRSSTCRRWCCPTRC